MLSTRRSSSVTTRRWQKLRSLALDDPKEAQKLLAKWGENVKIPIFNQSGIHGNEFEGVDSNMQLISDLATTPYGTDPKIDNVLDHMILAFNVIQNPDGRVAGARANGNGFDLNRDYLTQSQSETQASVAIQQKWLAPEALDLHGYVTPTLVESTTKPHNPGIEYDLYIPWNQARSDANEAGLAAIGLGTTRPVNDWCPEADFPGPTGLCEDGSTPGPAVAEGWDDWGPFYTGQYAQLLGFDSSTVEMCNSTGTACSLPGATDFPRGRYGAFRAQQAVSWSTMEFDVANRQGLLDVQLEVYRRGVKNADRPSCCPAPFDVANNWMTEYPKAHVIPFGKGQRSDAEANRLVRWLLANGIEVEKLERDTSFGGQKYEEGSYVVWMSQALRGLANTALSIGVDISADISQLYAPPGAWSHGYLWGADVVEIPRDAKFKPKTSEIRRPNRIDGGVESGSADAYALELDSATAVRAVNALVGAGHAGPARHGGVGQAPGGLGPLRGRQGDEGPAEAGRAHVRPHLPQGEDERHPRHRADRPRAADRRAHGSGEPGRVVAPEPRLPADPVSTWRRSTRPPTDPLVNYDVIWNTGELARRAATQHDGAGSPDGVLRGRRRLPRGRCQRRQLPHHRGPGGRADGRYPRAATGGAASSAGATRAARASPIVGALPVAGHGHRRPADVVHGGAGVAGRRRPPAADGLLRVRPLAARRRVGDGSGLAARRPRPEHRRHGPAHRVRDEPALPGGPRA